MSPAVLVSGAASLSATHSRSSRLWGVALSRLKRMIGSMRSSPVRLLREHERCQASSHPELDPELGDALDGPTVIVERGEVLLVPSTLDRPPVEIARARLDDSDAAWLSAGEDLHAEPHHHSTDLVDSRMTAFPVDLRQPRFPRLRGPSSHGGSGARARADPRTRARPDATAAAAPCPSLACGRCAARSHRRSNGR